MLTTKEAAKKLGVTPATIRRLIFSGKLKGYRIGNLLKVEDKDIDDYLQRSPGAKKVE